MVILMELKIVNAYRDEEQKKELMDINKQIECRINEILTNQYNVKNGYEDGVYLIYKTPVYYSSSKLKNILRYVIYQIDFLIQDILNSNKYFIMQFTVKDNKIFINAYSLKQVKKFQSNLDMWFNSMDMVEVIITKQYFD